MNALQKLIKLETRSSGLKLLAPETIEKGKLPCNFSNPNDALIKIPVYYSHMILSLKKVG